MNLSDRVLEPEYLPTRLSCHSIQPYKTWAHYLYNMELRGNMDLYFILPYSLFNSHGYDSRFNPNPLLMPIATLSSQSMRIVYGLKSRTIVVHECHLCLYLPPCQRKFTVNQACAHTHTPLFLSYPSLLIYCIASHRKERYCINPILLSVTTTQYPFPCL